MEQAKRGRPRSVGTQQTILSTAYELLLEIGFGAVTVEKIAERAKVSKATIYKWWPNKAAVVMDGYLSAATQRLPVPDSGSVQQDLLLHAGGLVRFLTGGEGRIITQLIGEGQFDPGLAEEYRTRYFHPRRQEAKNLLQRGVERGELKAGADLELCVDLIYGPLFYRLLVTGGTLDESYVERLVHLALEGIQ